MSETNELNVYVSSSAQQQLESSLFRSMNQKRRRPFNAFCPKWPNTCEHQTRHSECLLINNKYVCRNSSNKYVYSMCGLLSASFVFGKFSITCVVLGRSVCCLFAFVFSRLFFRFNFVFLTDDRSLACAVNLPFVRVTVTIHLFLFVQIIPIYIRN